MVVKLYNGIYRALANDPEILNLLGVDTGLTASALALKKADKIQKRKKPQNLSEGLPLIAFYTPGGGKDANNDEVYNGIFLFDVYTNDDVNKAHQITERIEKIFKDEIPAFPGLTTFETGWEDSFESETNLPNTYCFTTVLTFSVGLDS